MCDCDFMDPPSFHCKRTLRARKLHKCCECNRVISPGTEYIVVTGLWDGTLDRFKICCACEQIRSLLFRDNMCAPYTALVECASEYLSESNFTEPPQMNLETAEHLGAVGGFLYRLWLGD